MSKNYQQAENQLFSDWKKKRKPFIEDGVVNPSEFKGFKIVYILKEANDKDCKKGWDLRKYLAEGGRRQTWDNIALWTHGIKNHKKDFNWNVLESELRDPNFRKNTLQLICAFNIKKEPGPNKSNDSVIKRYGKEDFRFLRQQFEIYCDCNLFVCCGTPTGSIIRKHVLEGKFTSWDKTKRGIWYHKIGNNKHIIYYSHPEARVDKNLLYYGLVDGVKEIIDK